MPDEPNDSGCRYTSFLCGKGTFYISLAVMILFILNCSLMAMNRMLQSDIANTRASLTLKNTRVAQNQTFGNIYQNILQALAHAAVNKGDTQIKQMLEDNGLRIQKGVPPAAAGSAPAATPESAPASKSE